jgi:hypothetical protein
LNLVLLSIGIGRNLNIATRTKAYFKRGLYGDIGVELGLVGNKVNRTSGLALLLSAASIAF